MKELVQNASGRWEVPPPPTHARIYRVCSNYKNGYNIWVGYADGSSHSMKQSDIERYITFADWETDLIPYTEDVASEVIRLNKEERAKLNSTPWIIVKRPLPANTLGHYWHEFEAWANEQKISNATTSEWMPFWQCWVAALDVKFIKG